MENEMETAGYVVRPGGLECCPLLAAQESQWSGSGAACREASQTFQSLLTGKKSWRHHAASHFWHLIWESRKNGVHCVALPVLLRNPFGGPGVMSELSSPTHETVHGPGCAQLVLTDESCSQQGLKKKSRTSGPDNTRPSCFAAALLLRVYIGVII